MKIVASPSWLPAVIEITTPIGAEFILDQVVQLEVEYNEDGSTSLFARTRGNEVLDEERR